jgi:transposase
MKPDKVHVRRNFYEIHVALASPTAAEALERIGRLYAIESEIRGRPPSERAEVRQARAGPELESLHSWLGSVLPTLSKKSELATAIRYALSRWAALTRYRDDGRVEMGRVSDWRGNDTLRGVAVVRQSRCLSPRRVSRFQSLLVEPDMQNYRIRLSRTSLRPSH